MKTSLCFLLVAFVLPCFAEEFIKNNGSKVEGTLSRVEPDGIVLMTDAGIEKVKFSDLPAEIGKKYGFDPVKAAAHAQAIAAASNKALRSTMTAEAAAAADKERLAQSQSTEPAASAAPSDAYVNPLIRAVGQTTITGTVKQRTPEGLLVSTRARGDDGLVWLRGADAKENMRVSIPAVKDGTYSYETVGGAAKMLDAFRALK